MTEVGIKTREGQINKETVGGESYSHINGFAIHNDSFRFP